MSVFIRWLLAAGCIYLTVKCIGSAMHIGAIDPLAVGFVKVGVATMLLAVILTAPETALRVCELCSRFFTNLVFPNARFDKPELSYVLARLYSKQMRYAESIAEYRKMIHYYPQERTAYHELIAVSEKARESKVAAQYTKAFKKRFGEEPLTSALEDSRGEDKEAGSGDAANS